MPPLLILKTFGFHNPQEMEFNNVDHSALVPSGTGLSEIASTGLILSE